MYGICSSNTQLVHLSYSGNGSGYTDVFCDGGQWVYNEMYGTGWTITASQGSSSVTLTVNSQSDLSDGSGMKNCSQPYSWDHEMTDAFGTLSCHAVAYCSDGTKYVAADWVASDCQ